MPEESVLVRRSQALQDAYDRGPDFAPAPGPVLVKVVDLGNISTSGNVYFACHQVSCGGPEVEGGGANLAEAADVFYVAVLGSAAPKAGDYLIARPVSAGRWAADLFQDQGTVVPECPCGKTPIILHMNVPNPGQNGGMFQPTNLVYGPTPPEYGPLNLPSSTYLSPGSFVDEKTGDSFRYWFSCYGSYYVVSRVYVKSVLGSPHLDFLRYSWLYSLNITYYPKGVNYVNTSIFVGGNLPGGTYNVGVTENSPVGETRMLVSSFVTFDGWIPTLYFYPLIFGNETRNIYLGLLAVGEAGMVLYEGNVTADSLDLTHANDGTKPPPSPGYAGGVTFTNQCSPFRMEFGNVYPGGDPATVVTVTA